MKKIASFLLSAALLATTMVHAQTTVQVAINANAPGSIISKNIYGHFSEDLGRCIYDGFWADPSTNTPKQGRISLDVVEALKKIKVPLLRWPGGCYADRYHWSDGIGEPTKRPKRINSTWGMVEEDNSFGTNEFLQLCDLIGCEPYIAGNVGSGTPQEMSDWIEYLNFNGNSTLANLRKQNGHEKPYKVAFWGVGNESWGCGGNMSPEFYSDQYRRYASFCLDYPGAPLKRIASGANADDYNWTETCMKKIGKGDMWGISMHYYTITENWQHKGSATQFDEKAYFAAIKSCLHIEDLVNKHSAIMDKYDPEKKVSLCVDEWGIWTDVEPGTNPAFLYQQNSMRDAIIAASTLNIFNNHSDRIRLASLAQTVNVLQALILTNKEKMLLTPTYHVFDLYKVHQDATLLPVKFFSPDYAFGADKLPAINASASKDKDGAVHISLVNADPHNAIKINASLLGLEYKNVSGQILTSAAFTDINTFDNPNNVKPAAFTGFKTGGDGLAVTLPPLSVVVLEIK